MSRTCYIVPSTLPSSFGWQPRASGIRAEQLAAQARLVFDEVRTVLILERYDLLRSDRGFATLAAPRADTIIIPEADFKRFCDRVAPATFVFMHSDFADRAAEAAGKHTIVYDIGSLQELRLERAGASEGQLSLFRTQHEKIIELSRRAIVDNPKAARWLKSDLKGQDKSVAPLAPDVASSPTQETRTHLLFGGRVARWIDMAPTYRTMAAYLADKPSVPAIMVAPDPKDGDPNVMERSALSLMTHVTTLWNLSVHNQAEIFAMSFGAVDWAPLDEERVHSLSLPTLQAVAAGVPVLNQPGTPLDDLWDPFPGERLQEPLNVNAVSTFVERARSGVYDDAVKKAQATIARWRTEPGPFEGLAA
ncbi:MAG: hypothetical protein AAGB11_14635 [Pseudomonadota bacterium]